MTKLKDAYISIELKSERLNALRNDLKEMLSLQMIESEDAATSLHVSLAYGLGDVGVTSLESTLESIAEGGRFLAKARGFEILRGQATAYDYLVLTLDGNHDVESAIAHASSCLIEDGAKVKHFEGGFKSHVSLLKFPKGAVSDWAAFDLVRELNASYGAVFALGQCICLEGDCVCAFTATREAYLKVPFASVAA